MPLLEIREDQIVQMCAACDTHNQLLLSTLTAGTQRDGHVEPRIIALPPCSTCGSREFLIRSAPDEPDASTPGSYAYRHRFLVDAVHSQLVKLDRVISTAAVPEEGAAAPSGREGDLSR